MVTTNFSNIDVFAISKELDALLTGSMISNVYEVEDMLILKLNTDKGRKNLIIKSDSRINLTNYDYPIPKYPNQYIMSLRKFLKNRRILSVSQFNFDRIIVLELSNLDTTSWKFIIELFNKGNFLLLDENNILKIAKKYRKFKDRDVLAGKEFLFPKSRGKDFISIKKEEFKDIIREKDEEIVRILARNINIAGLYAEELCLRANLDKKKSGIKLNEEELECFFDQFKTMRNEILFGKIKPYILLDDDKSEIGVYPFELEIFSEKHKKNYESYNNAVDDFYSKIDSEILKMPSDQRINQKIKNQEKILKNQLEYMEELEKKKSKYYEQGDFIYSNFKILENLLHVISSARTKGFSWEEINQKLVSAKEEKMSDVEYFDHIVPATKQIVLKTNDETIYIDLTKSIGENASMIYEKGKKADKKIKGTLPAIEQTRVKIEKLKEEKELIEVEVDFLVKKPKKKWYEKFHWFVTSDDFLVVGGKDASSNEIIFKKYLDSHDLVFHTNFPGSPLTILKNPESREIPERSIKEAADFVASYSRAWKESWGFVDVFYVHPEQVSKTPPSGEFLPKGSFMITGKKNIIKNAKIELAISLDFEDLGLNNNETTRIMYPKLVCGPKKAIEKHQSGDIVVIKPSKAGLSKGKIAKELKNFFLKASDSNKKKWIKLLSIDEILLCLPSGSSILNEN
ncbi:MAG: NFACT family protein [Candidatus Lokiarchaeota archaeon]|nr:NFACT family protein [Candidatus Lokiarchaeota archaeon]